MRATAGTASPYSAMPASAAGGGDRGGLQHRQDHDLARGRADEPQGREAPVSSCDRQPRRSAGEDEQRDEDEHGRDGGDESEPRRGLGEAPVALECGDRPRLPVLVAQSRVDVVAHGHRRVARPVADDGDELVGMGERRLTQRSGASRLVAEPVGELAGGKLARQRCERR